MQTESEPRRSEDEEDADADAYAGDDDDERNATEDEEGEVFMRDAPPDDMMRGSWVAHRGRDDGDAAVFQVSRRALLVTGGSAPRLTPPAYSSSYT